MINVNHVLCTLLGIIVAGLSIYFIVALRRARKQHCWACRRLSKAEGGDRVLRLELRYHFHLWATRPAIEPDRERS